MSAPLSVWKQVFARRLLGVAGNSLLVYDYLVTFSLEITHIWDSPWTAVKVIFLLNRYGNLIGQTFLMLEETGYLTHNSPKFCGAFGIFSDVFAVFSGESIRLLVVMRACAILGCARSVAVTMNVLYVFCVVAILVASLIWSGNVSSPPFEYLDEIEICFAPVHVGFWTLWFIPLALDSLVLLIVCLSLYRTATWSSGYHPSRLIRLLARDAVWFYSAAVFTVVFYMVFWTFYRLDPINGIPILITSPILSVVGQRLVFNLRQFRLQSDSTGYLSREIHRQMAAIASDESDFPSDADVELAVLGEEPAVR